MAEGTLALAGLVALALVFDYINGMHDTANAIATAVSTRVLSPRQAIVMSASLNFLGALASTAVASTIGKGIVDPHLVGNALVAAALLGAIAWNLITWYYGIPSSSSHALIGGLVGATASLYGFRALNLGGLKKIISALVFSPVMGYLGGFAIMVAILWLFRRTAPGKVNKWFRRLQVVSAAFMALSHGSNDAQKSMGVITMALVGAGMLHTFAVPTWVKLACAGAMALGTASGGWRIIKTMGLKMFKLAPVHGFAAETGASLVIWGATALGAPVSTTHVISGSILGVGSTRGARAVRWGVAGQMAIAWVLTIPATALIAAAVGLAMRAWVK